jgi:hypothetical protein
LVGNDVDNGDDVVWAREVGVIGESPHERRSA